MHMCTCVRTCIRRYSTPAFFCVCSCLGGLAFLLACSQVIEADLKKLGYVLQWHKLDSAQYLLPQRRNRIYCTGDLDVGQSAAVLQESMAKTLERLSGAETMDVFDSSLPPEPPLQNENQITVVGNAVKAALLQHACRDVFVDKNTSTSRPPEHAPGVTTCIRPTHGIYSTRMQRHLTVEELWKCQGLFPDSFHNAQAVKELLQQKGRAQDFAGNAMSSTCIQAHCLAGLVHAKGWSNLCTEPAEADQPCRGTKRPAEEEPWMPVKRIRGKQRAGQEERQIGSIYNAGCSKRTGKYYTKVAQRKKYAPRVGAKLNPLARSPRSALPARLRSWTKLGSDHSCVRT